VPTIADASIEATNCSAAGLGAKLGTPYAVRIDDDAKPVCRSATTPADAPIANA